MTFESGVVPKSVQSDARLETEVDERDGHDARLVVGTEQEEIIEHPRNVSFFSGGNGRTERTADHELTHEIGGRKQNTR
jgi:hypothetical protein